MATVIGEVADNRFAPNRGIVKVRPQASRSRRHVFDQRMVLRFESGHPASGFPRNPRDQREDIPCDVVGRQLAQRPALKWVKDIFSDRRHTSTVTQKNDILREIMCALSAASIWGPTGKVPAATWRRGKMH